MHRHQDYSSHIKQKETPDRMKRTMGPIVGIVLENALVRNTEIKLPETDLIAVKRRRFENFRAVQNGECFVT